VIHEAMRDIYERLKAAGYTPSFVRSLLPDWWEDKFAEVPSSRAYAEGVIARQLRLELSSLRDKHAKLQPQLHGGVRLKHRRGETDDDFTVAVTLGSRLATIASLCLDTPAQVDGLNAASIRKQILDTGAPWVGFSELLDYCWQVGIPVTSLRKLPQGARKPDGMAVWTESRPAIVISSARRQPAWHLFILAHELGHLVKKHIKQGEVGVDSDVKAQMTSTRKDEIEANAFAVELLSGDPNISFSPPGCRLNATQLANAARSIGQQLRIDPGFIALSYSRSQGFIPVGAAALNEISPTTDACALYRRFYERLDMDELAEDNQRAFEVLTEAA